VALDTIGISHFVLAIGVAVASTSSMTACKSSGDGGGGSVACDPIGPRSTTIENVLGAGRAANGKVYVMTQGASYEPDIFIAADGASFEQKDTTGSGQSGQGANTDWSVGFVDGPDAGFGENLLLQIRNGTATAMALGPATTKGFIGTPGATSETLTIVDAQTIAGTQASALPVRASFVGDGPDDHHIVMIPGEPPSTNPRLFYGVSAAMKEYQATALLRAKSSLTTQTKFTAGSVTYTLTTGFAGDGGVPLQPKLTGDDGSETTYTSRDQIADALPEFSFECL
jgi:hypothetical protein